MPTFETATTQHVAGGAASISWSHTLTSGSNRIFQVLAGAWSNVNDLTTCTYNGISLTEGSSSDLSNRHVNLYYLLEASLPSDGSHTVVVNANGSGPGGWCGVAFAITDLAQQAPTTSTHTSEGSVESVSNTITPTQGAVALDFLYRILFSDTGGVPDPTISGDQDTERAEVGGLLFGVHSASGHCSSVNEAPDLDALTFAWTWSGVMSGGTHARVSWALAQELHSVNETVPVGLTEGWSGFGMMSPAETVTVALSETTALQVQFGADDTITLPLIESSRLLKAITLTMDTVVVQLLEAGQLRSFVSLAETLPVTLQEAALQLQHNIPLIADTLRLSIGETVNLLVALSPGDSMPVILQEGDSFISIVLSVAETLPVSLEEAFLIAVTLATIDETIVLRLLESTSLAISQEGAEIRNVSDVLNLLVEESQTVLVQAVAGEALSVQMADELLLLERTISLAETLNLNLVERASLLVILQQLTDTLNLSLDEAAEVVTALQVSDILALMLTEGSVGLEITTQAFEVFTERIRTEFARTKTPGPYSLSPPHGQPRIFNK